MTRTKKIWSHGSKPKAGTRASGQRNTTRRRERDLRDWLAVELAHQYEPAPVVVWSSWSNRPAWARSVLTAEQVLEAAQQVAFVQRLDVRVIGPSHAIERIELVPK